MNYDIISIYNNFDKSTALQPLQVLNKIIKMFTLNGNGVLSVNGDPPGILLYTLVNRLKT